MVNRFYCFFVLLGVVSCSNLNKNMSFPDTTLPGFDKPKAESVKAKIEIYDEKSPNSYLELGDQIVIIIADKSYSSFCLPYVFSQIGLKESDPIFANLDAELFLTIYYRSQNLSEYSWHLFRAVNETSSFNSVFENIISNSSFKNNPKTTKITEINSSDRDGIYLNHKNGLKKYLYKNLKLKKKIISLEDNLNIDDKIIGTFENQEQLRSLPSFCEKLKI